MYAFQRSRTVSLTLIGLHLGPLHTQGTVYVSKMINTSVNMLRFPLRGALRPRYYQEFTRAETALV